MGAGMPVASVLLPVYNGAPYIAEAVQSILHQSYRNFALYVIDDGSSDDTMSILESIDDTRLTIVKNDSNLGLIRTLNKGLDMILERNYTYIIRMDADDICLPHRIEKQIDFMEANPDVGLCGSWVEEFNESGTIKISKRSADDRKIRSELFFQNTLWHPSVIMRADVIRQYNIRYEPAFLHAEDYAFWCRMAHVTELANLQEVLLRYRVHTSNVSVKYSDLQRDTAIGINLINLDHYLLDNETIPQSQKEIIKKSFASLLNKIPEDANLITKDEITVLQKILDVNDERKAFDPSFFRQDMSEFLLHYLSFWCPAYSRKIFILLFVYGHFFSKRWSLKQQMIVAGKCLVGWRARKPKTIRK